MAAACAATAFTLLAPVASTAVAVSQQAKPRRREATDGRAAAWARQGKIPVHVGTCAPTLPALPRRNRLLPVGVSRGARCRSHRPHRPGGPCGRLAVNRHGTWTRKLAEQRKANKRAVQGFWDNKANECNNHVRKAWHGRQETCVTLVLDGSLSIAVSGGGGFLVGNRRNSSRIPSTIHLRNSSRMQNRDRCPQGGTEATTTRTPEFVNCDATHHSQAGGEARERQQYTPIHTCPDTNKTQRRRLSPTRQWVGRQTRKGT